jgi:hypothetical protein
MGASNVLPLRLRKAARSQAGTRLVNYVHKRTCAARFSWHDALQALKTLTHTTPDAIFPPCSGLLRVTLV